MKPLPIGPVTVASLVVYAVCCVFAAAGAAAGAVHRLWQHRSAAR